jgi:hypothetical protein
MESFIGAYKRPVIVCDSTGEWGSYGLSLATADALANHLRARLEARQYPEPILSVSGRSEIEWTFALVREVGIPCTLIVDEVDLYAPNSGAANGDFIHLCRRGRHVQGNDYPYGCSIIAGVHAGQNCSRALTRAAEHVCFAQDEPNASGRAEKYLFEDVDVSKLEDYEYVVSRGIDRLSFSVTRGEPGPHAYRINLDSQKIEKTRSF